MKPWHVVVVLSFLAACEQGSPTVGARSPGQPASATAQAAYERIISKYPRYRYFAEPKVMMACLSTSGKASGTARADYKIRQLFSYSTSENSDGPIFTGQLTHGVKRVCVEWAAKTKTDCTCYMVDSNGQNVLNLP